MKTKFHLALMVFSALALSIACTSWMKGGGNRLVITYKTDKNAAPITRELLGKQSVMTTSELTTTANGQAARIVMYSIYVANYDSDVKALETQMPSSDDQIKVEIQVVAAEGSTASTPLKTATYTASQFSDGINKFNKALDIRVKLFEKGKVLDQGISTVSPRKGFVKINSVVDDSVKGELDMSDDFRSVKGEFNAKIVKQ